MPVLDSNPHEITKRTEATPYGCVTRVFRDSYPLKVRDYTIDGNSYEMFDKQVVHKMSRECRYDKSLTDPRCRTCLQRGLGEEYSRKIREQGN